MKSKTDVRAALTGPIPTIRTPYLENGEIDYRGLKNMIDFDIQVGGAKSIVLTVGDSHLIAMSDQEIADVTKATTEYVNGRALVVAADRYYDTKQAVSFAKFAGGVGADVVMVLPPDWAASGTPESFSEHYTAVGRHLPVMIVTGGFIPRGSAFALKTIELTLERTENLVAIKDDMCGEFARKLGLLAHERCAVWAGGLKQNHLNMAPYGGVGYLSTFLTFKPEIAWRYWKAWAAGDLAGAVGVIRDYDMPLLDFISGLPGGFDAAMHGLLELYGLAKRWRPNPYHSLTDAEMERLSDFLKSKLLLSKEETKK
ncbi:MAG: dihydrodipicolinate synthase family protein [Lentisphaerota bacterium]